VPAAELVAADVVAAALLVAELLDPPELLELPHAATPRAAIAVTATAAKRRSRVGVIFAVISPPDFGLRGPERPSTLRAHRGSAAYSVVNYFVN
jgi:hypothetical protein